jgi:hypothetical protein
MQVVALNDSSVWPIEESTKVVSINWQLGSARIQTADSGIDSVVPGL